MSVLVKDKSGEIGNAASTVESTDREITAKSAPKAPEAQITEGVSLEAAAEALDATIEEVKAAEVALEVEEKGVSAPSIEEANPPVEEYEFLTSADSGDTASVKESFKES
jgi:hypothetical protein